MTARDIKLTESYVCVERTNKEKNLRTILDCLKHHSSTLRDREALVFVSSDYSREVVTWLDLYGKVRITATALVHLGVKKGEIVAVNIRNCPEWLYVVLGAMMAGAIPVSIAFTYTDGSDLISMMEKLQRCSLLVMDPGVVGDNWNIIKKLVEIQNKQGHVSSIKLPYLRYLIAHERSEHAEIPDVMHLREFIGQHLDTIQLPDVSADDIAFLFQTSGSTGLPKLVAHTQHSLRVCQQLSSEAVADHKSIVFNDRPFAWIGGFPLTLITGLTRVTLSGFCEPPEDRAVFLIEVAKREKCSSVSVLPQMVHEFIRRQGELTFDWPIMMLTTGGQPMGKSISKCIGKVAPALGIAYGATELQIGAFAYFDDAEKFEENCCGKLFQGAGMEMKIVDEDGTIVPVEKYGEIYIRSEAVFKEYFNDPEQTAAVKTSDDWYKTNDLGKLTEMGILYVEGRKSSVIISGGMNVVPDILERIIESHPGVEAAVIVPVPDEAYYQVLCACVVLQPQSDVNEQQLRNFLREYHNDKPGLFTLLPKYYLFPKAFPEVFTGKPSRKVLTDMATSSFGGK